MELILTNSSLIVNTDIFMEFKNMQIVHQQIFIWTGLNIMDISLDIVGRTELFDSSKVFSTNYDEVHRKLQSSKFWLSNKWWRTG